MDRTDKELVSELRKSVRKAWLESGKGLDKTTILDILVYTEVRGLARDRCMAEILEDVAFFGDKVPLHLEWYEGDYLRFVQAWADDRRRRGKAAYQRLKALMESEERENN